MTDERHYCLAALESAREILLSAAETLPKLRAGYDKHKDDDKGVENLTQLHKTVRRVQTEFVEIIQSLNELESEDEVLQTAQKLYSGLLKFRWLESSYEKVCGALTVFANSLPREENINKKALGRLMNRVKMGYFPTDLSHVKLIKDALEFSQTPVNLLDPCCGCGTALQFLANGENAVKYGIEIDKNRAEKAEAVLDRVGYGTFFRARLSNRAFHAVFLNPPYMSVMQQGGGSQRAEISFLIDILRYLMIDGILIYIIPYYRLTESISTILSNNFNDLRVYKFTGSEFKKYKQVVIFGKRKERSLEVTETANQLLNFSLHHELIPEITELRAGLYSLPEKDIAVKLYKGAEFNVNELAVQLRNSGNVNFIFEKSKLDVLHRNPLLPLKVGQIGLIGGSGLMNGLIECDTPHIIKGRVIKHTTTETTPNTSNGTEEIRRVTSNRMIFHVLTPYGLRKLS